MSVAKSWAFKPKRGRPKKRRSGKPVAIDHLPVAESRVREAGEAMRAAAVALSKDDRDLTLLGALLSAGFNQHEAVELVGALRAYAETA